MHLQVVAQRERAESEVAKANAQREQQEAVEARVTAVRCLPTTAQDSPLLLGSACSLAA